MVSWGWIPICLIIGGCIGVLLTGLIAAGQEDEPDDDE